MAASMRFDCATGIARHVSTLLVGLRLRAAQSIARRPLMGGIDFVGGARSSQFRAGRHSQTWGRGGRYRAYVRLHGRQRHRRSGRKGTRNRFDRPFRQARRRLQQRRDGARGQIQFLRPVPSLRRGDGRLLRHHGRGRDWPVQCGFSRACRPRIDTRPSVRGSQCPLRAGTDAAAQVRRDLARIDARDRRGARDAGDAERLCRCGSAQPSSLRRARPQRFRRTGALYRPDPLRDLRRKILYLGGVERAGLGRGGRKLGRARSRQFRAAPPEAARRRSLLTTIQVSSVAGGASYPRCHGMTPCLQRWPRAHADHVTSSYPSYRETALTEIGRHVITVGWSPGALAVSRIITVQAERFPELERLAHEEGWVAAVKGVARVLAHYVERNEISVGDPELAADMFLNLVLGRAHSGGPLRYPRTRKAMEQRVQAAVRLFLEGVIVRRT